VATGYFRFFRHGNTLGFNIPRSHTSTYVHIGAAATIAMGLTEACSTLGRGKVRGRKPLRIPH
jgi:hypothetical protein